MAFAAFISQSALADVRINDFGIRNLNFGSWTGGGGVELTQAFCVESVEGRRNRSVDTRPYSLEIARRDANSGFYLEGPEGNLPFELQFIDLRTRSVELMREGIATALDKTGAAQRCRTEGNNAAVQINFQQADLQNAAAGRYRSRFQVLARGGSNGTETHRLNNITLSFAVDALIAVNKLDDLQLLFQPGGGDVSAVEELCVYQNGGSSFNLSVSSQAQAPFTLEGDTGAVPYRLRWRDELGELALSDETIFRGRRIDRAGGLTCQGGNNAALLLDIAAEDAASAGSGRYRDTIVIRVSPE